MFTAYRFEILAALIAALLVPLLFVLGRSIETHYISPESHPVKGYEQSDPCPGESGLTSSCWIGYYEAFLDRYSSSDALHNLKARYEAGGPASTFCHPLLHIIGAAAGKEYDSVQEAYEHGETFCRAGYYHGVLEGMFGDDRAETLFVQLDSLCAAIPGKERYSYNYFSCVHGIGHGLMAYLDHDLFQSLEGCAKLSGEWEQSSCAGGVFMENVISDSPEMPSRFLRTDDPLYPCNAVSDFFRGQCYLMQTSHMLTIFNGDFGKTFATCGAIEEKHQRTCYQSLGRDASGWSYGSPEAARAYCAFGRTLEERSHCLIGAAVDYLQSVGEDGARSLCALGEDGARIPCIQAVEMHLRTM